MAVTLWLPASGQQPCAVAFSATDVQPRQSIHIRQNREEGGRVKVIAVDVVSGPLGDLSFSLQASALAFQTFLASS